MNLARKRLTRKLVLLTLAPATACIAVAAVVLAFLWQRLLADDADRELADHVALVRATLPRVHASGALDLAEIEEELSRAQVVLGVALYDAEARPIGQSALLARAGPRLDAIAREVLASGKDHHAIDLIGGEEALVRAERMAGPSGLAVVVVSHSLDPVREIVRDGVLAIAIAGALLAAALAALAWLLSTALGNALGDLIQAAELVSSGDLSARVAGSRTFELDAVARAWSDMTTKLGAAQAERRELTRRIQHAQALTLVGQVSASFAHEIGSPLNTILGWARIASADEALPPATRQQFDTIAGQCARIARIVERMLRMARPAAEERNPCDLGEVLREVAAFVSPDCHARRIEVRVDAATDAPHLRWMRDELLQLVLNLAMNAVQAQPNGGELSMRLAREGDRAILTVEDRGPGVPEEVRGRVFEPFYSTKRPHGGTGLGLWIVADIVRELRGTIEISDRAGGGAVFRVALPGEERGGPEGPSRDQLECVSV